MTHLSISERYILTFIKYKTNNNHKFFMNNEAIAKQIGCKVSSTKTMVNKLIREGYLLKITEGKRRFLSLSGEPFIPLDGVDMANQEKYVLKQDISNFEMMENEYKQRITDLEKELESLEKSWMLLIAGLEKRGVTFSEIKEIIKTDKLNQTQT